MFSSLKTFFSAVHGSIQGILVPEELYRSLLTSLGSGTLVGLLTLLVQSILDHSATIFPNPAVASLASMILTLVLDLLRRQGQGTKPSPDPSPIPALVPTTSTTSDFRSS